MSSYQPLPADGRQVRWRQWDGEPLETVEVKWDNEAWTITAQLPARRTDYVIRASPFWHPRQFLLFRDLEQPDLWLGTDGNRRWGEINGSYRPELDAMLGIYVDDSLSSLALPILHLDIDVGGNAIVPLAHVESETLAITPHYWRFERTSSHRWTLERIEPDATTDEWPANCEFEVDQFGLPIDVEDRCRREPT